jgi:ferredoxin--NADP+ reductase/benzoate/toluate 1,2-dioxygenase reductase subunit
MVQNPPHRVHHVRHLHPGTFVLRLDRHDLQFEPGQHVSLGIPGSLARREYSIYSGAGDDYLEVLVREIEGGLVSRVLKRCEPGDVLSVEGPYGLFVTDPSQRSSSSYLFVASGTGLAPFHCLVRSYPKLDYLLLHGMRTSQERTDDAAFEPARYVACVSRGEGGDYPGRVTSFLRHNPVDRHRLCYLCGNSAMIDEAFGILRDRGVPLEHLFSEAYF